MKTDIKASYSAANVFPTKILHHMNLIHSCHYHHTLFPIHLQLNLTNKCQFDCGFCSCHNRDKTLELPFNELREILTRARIYGLESTTLTGGGEPLLYKKWDRLLNHFNKLGIDVGLVTNGVLLNRLNNNNSEAMVWCRISCSDCTPFELKRVGKSVDKWLGIIDEACMENGHVDWAFSYVLTKNADPQFVQRLVEFANEHDFTHFRLVCNIFNAIQVAPKMDEVEKHLKHSHIDDSKVIYQKRSSWTRGSPRCWIPLVKPVLAADNYWFACCGSQYIRVNKPRRDYEPLTRISKFKGVKGLVDFVANQRMFDGRVCERCFYDNYNQILDALLSEVKHERFV